MVFHLDTDEYSFKNCSLYKLLKTKKYTGNGTRKEKTHQWWLMWIIPASKQQNTHEHETGAS